MTFADLLGIASLMIACTALYMTRWQIVSAIEHNKIAQRPHLNSFNSFNEGKGSYTLYIENNGLGPAVISEFHVAVGGKVLEGEGDDMWRELISKLVSGWSCESRRTYLAPGHMMSPGKKTVVLRLQFHGDKIPKQEQIEKAFARADILVEYESVYGEKFSLTTEDNLF